MAELFGFKFIFVAVSESLLWGFLSSVLHKSVSYRLNHDFASKSLAEDVTKQFSCSHTTT